MASRKRIALYAVAALAVVGIAVVAGAVLYLRAHTLHITITQAELQAKLDQGFPIIRQYPLTFDVTYSNPKIVLDPADDVLRASVDVRTDFFKLPPLHGPLSATGAATVTTGLRFDPVSGSFFLEVRSVDRLDISHLPQADSAMARSTVGAVLRHWCNEHPVYSLQASNLPTTAAKLLLKKVTVHDGSVVITLGL